MSTWVNTLVKPSVTNEPPTDAELSRIDIAMIVTLLFALFLGMGIRNNAVTASHTVELGEGLPSIKVPDDWITGQPEGLLLQATNPRSPSNFNAEVNVAVLALPPGQDAVAARTVVSLQRTQELDRYRELDADRVVVLDGTEGILVTYAYVADPSREQGAIAPPVVVQAQDLIFPVGEGENAVIITFATDAATWDEEQPAIQLIQDSLDMEIQEPEDVVPAETETESDVNTEEFEEGGQ
jgi:hypothetical protein